MTTDHIPEVTKKVPAVAGRLDRQVRPLVHALRALPDTRPEPQPFEVWRDACGLAMAAADEIDRLHGVVAKVNARCDHLGMSLRDIKAERDTIKRLVNEVYEANGGASDGEVFRLLTMRQELAWRALMTACGPNVGIERRAPLARPLE